MRVESLLPPFLTPKPIGIWIEHHLKVLLLREVAFLTPGDSFGDAAGLPRSPSDLGAAQRTRLSLGCGAGAWGGNSERRLLRDLQDDVKNVALSFDDGQSKARTLCRLTESYDVVVGRWHSVEHKGDGAPAMVVAASQNGVVASIGSLIDEVQRHPFDANALVETSAHTSVDGYERSLVVTWDGHESGARVADRFQPMMSGP